MELKRGRFAEADSVERHTPVQVQNLSGVTAVAAGANFSLALKNDGTVWAWGRNVIGELGDGTTDQRDTPVQVQNLNGVTAVAVGGQYSLALKNDGTVWGWGDNDHGQLGDGTTVFVRLTPVQAQNLSWAAAVAAGWWHSLALVPSPPELTVFKILEHPDPNHLRLFNLKIDGVVVGTNVNSGSTTPQPVSPGTHTVSEEGGTGTPLTAFTTVIGGDCAAEGTVNLAFRDKKTCTITNYDNEGGCAVGSLCCESGTGTEACRRCALPGQCP
jgi:Regulator of chromosome condensation (RCC1) repeat